MLNFMTLLVGASLSAGFNVYLTVLAIGIFARVGTGSEALMSMIEPFGSWWVLVPSATLFLCEFVADKVPAFDNVWDVAHTVIRPVGAVFIALALASDAGTAVQIFAAVTGGSLALGSHFVKAGTRATARLNPEPVTNTLSSSVLSVLEDVAVVALTLVAMVSPWVAAGVLTALVLLLVWFGPRAVTLFGFVTHAFWSRLAHMFRDDGPREGPLQPVQASFLAFVQDRVADLAPVAKSKCYIKVPGLMNYRRGCLVVTDDALYLVYRQFWARQVRKIALADLKPVRHQPRWFREMVTLDDGERKTHLYFVRGRSGYVCDLLELLELQGVTIERPSRAVKPPRSGEVALAA